MSIENENFNNFKQDFGKRVKHLRFLKDLSQLDLAVQCNYEKTTISRIENGRANVTLRTIQKLSKGLEVSASEFFIK